MGEIDQLLQDKREDHFTRTVVEEALRFKATLGVKVAVAYLVEHQVPYELATRVLDLPGEPPR